MEQLASLLAQAQPALLSSPIDQQRVVWDAMASRHPLSEGVTVTGADFGGVAGELVLSPGADHRRLVMHLHGGGYVIGSPVSHRDLAARLSAATGAAVFVPAYRLAPEHPYPAALEDAAGAYRGLLGAGYQADRLALSGDSAGGGLLLAALAEARRRGEPMPAGAVCWSPWVDLAPRPAGAADAVLSAEWLAAMADHYLGSTDKADPGASPVYEDLRGLPPLLVLVGTAELLLDDARRLVAEVRRCDVEVELEEVEGAVHLWMALAPQSPEAVAAVARAGRFLCARWESTPVA